MPASLDSRTAAPLPAALRNTVVVLIALGVMAALGRAVFPRDFGSHTEPARRATLRAINLTDPVIAERPPEIARFDGRYAAHVPTVLLHVVPGGLFLILAPLQFSSRFRRRHIRVHRWTGRVLLSGVVASTIAGLYFGLLMPFAGPIESMMIAIVGVWMLTAVAKAYLAIRAKDVDRHREWMIRVFTAALGISSVRVVSLVADLSLLSFGFGVDTLLLISIAIGWPITIAGGELWIARTRERATTLAIANAA
jgi:uncharacterized membrane protein